jgi:hypothetical protein
MGGEEHGAKELEAVFREPKYCWREREAEEES